MNHNCFNEPFAVCIEAKFRKLLRDALERGTLASKAGLLKLIPKAGGFKICLGWLRRRRRPRANRPMRWTY